MITMLFSITEAISFAKVKMCSDLTMNNPFDGSIKVVVKIISILKNPLDFTIVGLEEEEP